MSRVCPLPGCGAPIPSDNFACRRHWATMQEAHRVTIRQKWDLYRAGKISLEELKGWQDSILRFYRPVGATDQAIRLAQVALAYIKKRKEYTACKDGFLEQKKKLGRELSALEKGLEEIARETIHPKQAQGTLFDPGAKDAKPAKLPD